MKFIDKSFRSSALVICTAGALLGATSTPAADSRLADAERTYRSDRAACMSGQTSQDRATCLQEAGAALSEARRGRLDDGDAQFERNRLFRCDAQPPGDREDCIRRMNGEGFTSGSVEGGGIYRELTTTLPASPGN